MEGFARKSYTPTVSAPTALRTEPFRHEGLTGTVVLPAAATRPPILHVHGLLGGAWYFAGYQQFFASRGYPAYAVNLRGHYDSRPVPDLGRVSVTDYVDDVLATARTLAGRHGAAPVLLGHSMGGLLVQKAAEAEPAAALVLLCSAPPRGIVVSSLTLIGKQLKYLVPMLRSRPLRGTYADNEWLTLNRMPTAAGRAYFDHLVPDSGRAAREISFGSITVDARRVRCPVLSVSAAEDRFVAPRIGRRLAEKYGGDYRCFPGHAHLIMCEPGWEGPAGAIEEWLRGATG